MLEKWPIRNHLYSFHKLEYLKTDESEGHASIEVDCSLGVSPFGCSKKIDKDRLAEGVDFEHYAPFPFNEMKELLIDYWKTEAHLSRNNMTICSGSMLILDKLNTMFIENGRKVLGYAPQFAEFVNSVRVRGGTYEAVPLKMESNYKFIPADMLEKLESGSSDYTMVYIDNPNNPTGQIIDIKNIEPIVAKAAKTNTVVIVDESYGDYMPKSNSAITILNDYDNLIVVRSFSKGFALAGLRVGYLITSSALNECYSIVDDLLVNAVGLKAAAISLDDKEHLPKTIKKTVQIKREIIAACNHLKVLETSMEVPIFTLIHPDENTNLHSLFMSKGCRVSSGFDHLGINAVRMRIPNESKKVIEIIRSIEKEIE